MTASPLHPYLLARLSRLQFDINCLGSVSIEYPRLRPAFDRLRGSTIEDLVEGLNDCESAPPVVEEATT